MQRNWQQRHQGATLLIIPCCDWPAARRPFRLATSHSLGGCNALLGLVFGSGSPWPLPVMEGCRRSSVTGFRVGCGNGVAGSVYSVCARRLNGRDSISDLKTRQSVPGATGYHTCCRTALQLARALEGHWRCSNQYLHQFGWLIAKHFVTAVRLQHLSTCSER